ncbi:hypothetical protein [Pseudomonas aeruginosa]|uniref:hypothetical protein n=1 Tax=Pseudomonas aeruginosa TaxID=287 RepID=UPI0034D1CC51
MVDSLLLDRLSQSLVIILLLRLLSVALIILYWALRPLRRAARLVRGIGPREPAQRISLADLPGENHLLAETANPALDRLAAP